MLHSVSMAGTTAGPKIELGHVGAEGASALLPSSYFAFPPARERLTVQPMSEEAALRPRSSTCSLSLPSEDALAQSNNVTSRAKSHDRTVRVIEILVFHNDIKRGRAGD